MRSKQVSRATCLLLFAGLVHGCGAPTPRSAVAAGYGPDTLLFRAELAAARTAAIQGDDRLADSLAAKVLAACTGPSLSKQRQRALAIIGHAMQAQRRLDSAEHCFALAATIAEEHGQKQDAAIAYNNLSTVLMDKGDLEAALKHQLRAIDLRREVGDSIGMAKSCNNLGNIHLRKNDTTLAERSFRAALAINARTGDSASWRRSLVDLSVVKMDRRAYDTAVMLLNEALRIRPRSGYGSELGDITGDLGLAYEGLGKLDSAKALYAQGIAQAGAEQDGPSEAAIHTYLADLLVRSRAFAEALPHLDSALAIARRVGDREFEREALKSMATFYETTGDRGRAYAFYKAYDQLADSLMNAEKDARMNELIVRNGVERTERENAALRAAAALTRVEASNTKWRALVMIVLLISIAVLLWARGQRSKERARWREAELEQQTLRLQMDPHFLFNALNSIPGLYSSTDSRTATAYVGHLSNLLRLILETSREVRVPLRKELDLLQHYVAVSAARYPGLFTFALEVDPAIDQDATSIPPMLLQPLVENAILHGLVPLKPGGLLSVSITSANGVLTCRVRDNGVGRRASTRERSGMLGTSRGLAITAERLRRHDRGRVAPDGLRVLDLYDEAGAPTGTEVVLRTAMATPWA